MTLRIRRVDEDGIRGGALHQPEGQAEEWLFRIPGVVGVAVGPKFVAGKLTHLPAIQIYVAKKRSRAEIPPDELIAELIEGVRTDVLEGAAPVEMSATVRCRTGTISSAVIAGGLVQITSTGHGLSSGARVRMFGVSLDKSMAALPINVTGPDVFTLPVGVTLIGQPLLPFAFWTEVSSFEGSLCCCPTGHITDAFNSNPVKITSTSHGLQLGDRIKIARITQMTQIRGNEYTVGKVTKDTFELKGIDGATFTMGGAGQESGDWEKVCIDRSGPIQRVRGAPVQFTSAGHTLRPGDRIHIIALVGDDLPITSWKRADPFKVATVAGDTFTVEELAGPVQDTAIIGCWIRILSDARMYSRVRGGIRLSFDRSDVVFDAGPLINTASTQLEEP